MKYKAFISYKHVVSSSFAKDVEFHIKKYARGPLQKPEKIFRDEQYFTVGGDLSKLIKDALSESEFLILLASPEAAESPWVREELHIWCNELKRSDRIIVILTSGTIDVDDDEKKINWKKTDALPKILKEHLPALPLFVDLSWAEHKSDRDLSKENYKSAINSIVAKLSGVTPNELFGKEWKVRKRNLQIAWTVSFSLVFLLIIAIISVLKLNKTNSDLEESIKLATSRELAAKSRLQKLPLSLETASRAVDTHINNESVNSLVMKLSDHQELHRHVLLSSEAVESLGVTNDFNKFYVLVKSKLIIFDKNYKITQTIVLPGNKNYLDVLFLPTGEIFAFDESSIWNVKSKKFLIKLEESYISAVGQKIIDDKLFVGVLNGSVISVDILTGQSKKLYSHDNIVTDISVGDTFLISTSNSRNSPVVHFSYFDSLITKPKEQLFSANAVALSDDYSKVAIAFENGEVGMFKANDFTESWLKNVDYSASAVAFQSEGIQIAFGSSDGVITVFDQKGSKVNSWQAANGAIWRLSWMDDILLSGSSDRWVKSWKPNQLLVPSQTYQKMDEIFWKNNSLIGIEGNKLYDLSSNQLIDTIPNWPSGRILDVNESALITEYAGKPIFYNSSFKKIEFPDVFDSLLLKSSTLSKDGNYVVSTWDTKDERRGAVSIWNTNLSTVSWLDSIPNYPISASMYNDEMFAVYGGSEVFVWSLPDEKLVSRSINKSRFVKDMKFLDKNNLVLGSIRGNITIVSTKNIDSTLFISEIPVGTLFDIETTPDKTILGIDVDGVKWFDHELNYLGTLINTTNTEKKRILPKIKNALNNNLLGIKWRNGEVTKLTLDIKHFSKTAKKRSETLLEVD